VGVVEREALLDGSAVRAGDVLLGLASSGLHANGFSLVRAVLAEHELDLATPYLEVVGGLLGQAAAEAAAQQEPAHALATLGEVLLTPTRIYAPDVLALRDQLETVGSGLHGLAHVTGGGLAGNVPRVLPDHLAARLVTDWPLPSVFALLAELGHLDGPELRATLNAGMGMVAVVPPEAVDAALAFFAARELAARPIGQVVERAAIDGARYVEVDGA
ncbi:MAG TPA: AIR synthase-related protein, partial [Candidatus Limnocylindrales bacterium]|nr:AIR synthase-related protein [Candidatus Limnocylindrales bacterium]